MIALFRDNLHVSAAETSQHKHHFAVKNRYRGAVTAMVLTALALAGCMSPGAGTVPSQSPLSPSSASGPPSLVAPTRTHPVTQSPRPVPSGSIVPVHDPGQVTGTVTGPCHYGDSGQLPDPRCTPGSYDPAVTQADLGTTICKSGYTKTVRPPESQTETFKFKIAYVAYGDPHSEKTELDHLVSLELGGSNDARNLWPETPPTPNPKDSTENTLHAAVCSGKVTLRAAQVAIAADWITAEKVLGLK